MLHDLKAFKNLPTILADIQKVTDHGHRYRFSKPARACEQHGFFKGFDQIILKYFCLIYIISLVFPQFAKAVIGSANTETHENISPFKQDIVHRDLN